MTDETDEDRMTTEGMIPGMWVTPTQLADALERDGFDRNITVGSVWQDPDANWLPEGHKRLVRIKSMGKTISGWQTTVEAYHGPLPADWVDAYRGSIYLKTLVAHHRRIEAGQ